MEKAKGKSNIFLFILLFTLIGLFVFSLFKNIQYPLLWGDEAETAIYAERILKYGFPVVHDENNAMAYFVTIKDWNPINKKNDAYTGNTWGQYYFATLGQYFAGQTTDIYQKTLFLRIPFALAGMVGVLILPLSVIFLYQDDKNKKLLFLVGYFFLILFLISLVLHFREVRSYSLAVLLSSLITVIFLNSFFAKNIPKGWYLFLMTVFLFLLSVSFPPAYLAIVTSLGTYLMINFYLTEIYRKNMQWKAIINIFFKKTFYLLSPFLISVIFMLPISKFFNMSDTSIKAYLNVGYNFQLYRHYLSLVIRFLTLHNYLLLGIFQKAVTIILFYVLKRKIGLEGTGNQDLKATLRLSVFLTYILVIHIFLVPLTPFLFDRYYIFLQPLLALIIVLDLFLNLEIIAQSFNSQQTENYRLGYFYLFFLFLMVSLLFKLDTIKGHIYELNNRYIGPVDAIISYINSNYKNSRDLLIDTTLEQSSFIYYLKSQLLCDEVIKCSKDSPDIIIIRRYMISPKDFMDKINNTIASKQYQLVLLPILDYPVNNIPEFTLSLRHLYQTPYTDNDSEKVILFVKN